MGATASGIITGNKIGRFKNVGVGAYSLAMLCLITFVIVRENCVCVCVGGGGGVVSKLRALYMYVPFNSPPPPPPLPPPPPPGGWIHWSVSHHCYFLVLVWFLWSGSCTSLLGIGGGSDLPCA